MAVRPAKHVDIPQLVRIMREAHARSRYAETAQFDEALAKQLCGRSIMRHGHPNYGGTLFLVSDTDGVHGFIIGMVDLVYPVLDAQLVTDLLFIFDESAEPADAIEMVRQIEAWALRCPKVIEIHLGVTDTIGDWQRVGRLYERMGFESCGGMWRKSVPQYLEVASV